MTRPAARCRVAGRAGVTGRVAGGQKSQSLTSVSRSERGRGIETVGCRCESVGIREGRAERWETRE